MEPEGPEAASAQPSSFIMRTMGPQRLRDVPMLHGFPGAGPRLRASPGSIKAQARGWHDLLIFSECSRPGSALSVFTNHSTELSR